MKFSKKTNKFFLSTFLVASSLFAQKKDTTQVKLDAVLVQSLRATAKTPVTFSNFSKKEIKARNLGQDIPVLLNFLPSVVSTSDAGNGVGYTGIRVRGTDATRVNVTINGIPYNDSESQGTFWVNMPDFASSTENIQLQRGVGTSTNGAGAFGASLNLLTDTYAEKANGEINNSFGSFGTIKNTVKFSTGLINKGLEIAGRFSKIKSNGFIDRASSDLKSYFLQGTFLTQNGLLKALVFGGAEKTYQSWNGIDAETMASNRRFNYAGMYTDLNGNTKFYDNETDNYKQDHAQLHWSSSLNDAFSYNLALHYTKGKGYYENYKANENFEDYLLIPIENISKTNLVRQKWLDNDFFGTTFSAKYKTNQADFTLGGAWNKYQGDHFGKVIWTQFGTKMNPNDKYYQDLSTKTDFNLYLKSNFNISEQLNLYADLQYRTVNYKANAYETGNVNDTRHFFNPKFGINYAFNEQNNFYLSFAKANREPNRTDFENRSTKTEKLDDYEIGWKFLSEKVKLNANIYYMNYKDQLILTGKLDDVGNPIRANADKSYRLGLEIDANVSLNKIVSWQPNLTWSNSKIKNLDSNTNMSSIAYSPNLIFGNILSVTPISQLQISVLQKFVGSQYLNNAESPEAKLPDYTIFDANLTYTFQTKKIFKSIQINGLVNNIFNRKYVSNGYMWDIYPYYYPQAGTNFLVGLNLNF